MVCVCYEIRAFFSPDAIPTELHTFLEMCIGPNEFQLGVQYVDIYIYINKNAYHDIHASSLWVWLFGRICTISAKETGGQYKEPSWNIVQPGASKERKP